MKKLIFILFFINSAAQNISLNEQYVYDDLRDLQLLGKLSTEHSFIIRPFNINNIEEIKIKDLYIKDIYKTDDFQFSLLSPQYKIEFNSNHPYNRNNGSMLPNRGYQHLFSFGIFSKIGPLEITLRPEHFFAQNLNFDGFPESHYPEIWMKRYRLWNHIDIPERFGTTRQNEFLLGQSSLMFNFNKISFGISNENLWWGPSIRNSIMLSNHAKSFNHLTIKSKNPINIGIGDIEFNFITGKLLPSKYTPPNTDYEGAGTKLYVQKINQLGEHDDWRFMQAFILNFKPSFIKNLNIGIIRWVQMYSALIRGEYSWMNGKPNYFPVFSNLFRKNDMFENYEAQIDQAGGFFLRWLWDDSNAEIYAELHFNDTRQNIRDFLLDTDHSSASTLGIRKNLKTKLYDYIFSWEWTRMEQTAGQLLRDSGSWYEHTYVYHGYTNNGEVLGSSIGPGSNSHYMSLSTFRNKNFYKVAFEIIENDNDFYHEAFSSARDFRRYWKDYNLHLSYGKKTKSLWINLDLVFVRSLNYKWELDDLITTPYYHRGIDKNNFHINLGLSYLFN